MSVGSCLLSCISRCLLCICLNFELKGLFQCDGESNFCRSLGLSERCSLWLGWKMVLVTLLRHGLKVMEMERVSVYRFGTLGSSNLESLHN